MKESADKRETVLLAVIGMSPAILTETVWALVHRKPAVVPDRVIVLTTGGGEAALKKVLFDGGGWDRMVEVLRKENPDVDGRLKFGLAADHIRLFPSANGRQNLQDIITPEDGAAAADFILGNLRQFTEDSGTRVVASLAGGRKTTGALLTSCMILLGRSQDTLCHVLVNPPYDSPKLQPTFLFPEKGVRHRLPSDGKSYPSRDAGISLIEVPFVRLRGYYERESRSLPPSYMSMVRRMQGMAPVPRNFPQVTVDGTKGVVKIGQHTVRPAPHEFALFYVLASKLLNNELPQSWCDYDGDIKALKDLKKVDGKITWFHDFCSKDYDSKEDFRKWAFSLRRKISKATGDSSFADALIPLKRTEISDPYPTAKISIIPVMELPDVSGRQIKARGRQSRYIGNIGI